MFLGNFLGDNIWGNEFVPESAQIKRIRLFVAANKMIWYSVFGKTLRIWDAFWETIFGKIERLNPMRKKNYKGRCIKKSVSKSKEVCRTYDDIQLAYLDVLQNDENIQEIRCNVLLGGDDVDGYMTDYLCVTSDGNLIARECVFRKQLLKPMTVKLLDASRMYWAKHGVSDWGLVIDA